MLLATAALLALTLAACGDEDPSPTAKDESEVLSLDDLDGRSFASVRVDGHRLVADTQIRLGFTGSDLSADAGCNHLFGTAALDGDALTVSSIGGTEMGCPDQLADQDAWLTEFLSGGTTVALAGATLTLTSGDVVVELVEQDAPDAPTGDPDDVTSNSDDDGDSDEGEQ